MGQAILSGAVFKFWYVLEYKVLRISPIVAEIQR